MQPHHVEYWLNPDPEDPEVFAEQTRRICDTYAAAIEGYYRGIHAVCVDDKTGIQALECDERGESNSPLKGALARMIREAGPHVRICCNACFWVGNGVPGDDQVYAALQPWSREVIDVSVPLILLPRDHPKCFELFDAPRPFRAFYPVSTQSAKSGAAAHVELYRRMAWDAARYGWNGWGFYSYYAPLGNPWTDFDDSWTEDRPDYLMVYPGPHGPIPTRHSEAVQEGWEDYCLLTLHREQGKQKGLEQILQE